MMFNDTKILERCTLKMGRYCIMCKKLFGCVKGDVKHDCSHCCFVDSCYTRHHFAMSQVTGGICVHCWEKRQTLKKAINY